MTVLTGAVTYLILLALVCAITFGLALLLEVLFGGGVIAVILGWIAGIGTQIFGIIVLAFWIYAMFQGHNPIEAFNYQMWE